MYDSFVRPEMIVISDSLRHLENMVECGSINASENIPFVNSFILNEKTNGL